MPSNNSNRKKKEQQRKRKAMLKKKGVDPQDLMQGRLKRKTVKRQN